MRERSLKSIRVFHACMTTTIAYVSICYIEGYTSPIEDAIINRGIMTINTFSLFATAIFIGGVIGSIFAGILSEWLGLKTCIIIFSQLGTFGAILLIWANDSVSMTIARLLIGIYNSICVSCVPVYNAQVAPESLKRFYGSLLGLALRLGMLIVYALGIWIGYRWLAVIYLMIVVFMNLNFVFLPESPRWLKEKGWEKKAKQACDYFHETPQEICESSELCNDSEQSKENINTNEHSRISEKISSYFVWPVIRPVLICSSSQFFKSVSGHEYLLAYSAHTLDNAVSINPRIAACFYPISLLIGSVIFLYTIRKISWRKLLFVTTLTQVVVNGLLSLTYYLSTRKYECIHNSHESTICQVLQLSPILLIVIYGLAFSMGWGSINWWLYGHVLHPHYTSVSAGIVNFVLFIAIITNQVIGPIIDEYFGSHILFLTCAVLCIIALMIQFFY